MKKIRKGIVKWRGREWVLPKGKTVCVPKSRRPSPQQYYKVLREAGRDLNHCELCNSDFQITVHHNDGNPYNNKTDNLKVLCWSCHLLFHDYIEDGVHHELEGTKADSDPLDDREIRRFYGIIDEEKDGW